MGSEGNGTWGGFNILAPRGLDYSNLGIGNTAKDALMVVVGGILSIFGVRFLIVNFSIVLILYVHQNLVMLLDAGVQKLASMSQPEANKLANFIVESPLHKILILFLMTLMVSVIVLLLLRFFMSFAIVLGFIFLFSRGPGAGFLIQYGITNEVVHLIFGIIAGVVVAMAFGSKLQRVLFVVLFAVVGVALIFGGLGEIFGLDLSLPYAILTLTQYPTTTDSFVKENLLFVISVLVSVVCQMR